MHDLAIVGAGPAGIAIAYYLRDSGLDVLILEAAGDIGGRTLSVPVSGVPACTGALFVYRGTPSEELAAELGVRTEPFVPANFGVHIAGQTVVDSDNDRLVDRLPVSELSRIQLREFISAAIAEYGKLTDGGRLTADASALTGERVSDRLNGLEPDVVKIITHAVRGGAVADPADLSAKYALRYFASYLAHEAENRLYPVDGMQSIPRALAARLPEGTIRLHAAVTRVTRVTDGEPHYLLDVEDGTTVQARELVLAVPAPVVQRLVTDLPQWKKDALALVKTPGSTTLNVTADVTGLDEVATWSFIAVTGYLFDAIINPMPGIRRQTGDGRFMAQFVLYGNTAGYRPDLAGTAQGTDSWVGDFLAVIPALRGRILGAHLQTWEHCFALLTPERLGALRELREPVDGIHFAGDYTSETAGTHGAYAEACRVAGLVQAGR